MRFYLKMGKENSMTLIKDLQAIRKQITNLAKQAEKLSAAIEKAEKPKAKAKTSPKKEPAKSAKITDTDKLLAVINRHKKGINTATLMKKTGFNEKKVRNILNRTHKQGKIKRVGKGIYVSAK
jgi:hypothetical protein